MTFWRFAIPLGFLLILALIALWWALAYRVRQSQIDDEILLAKEEREREARDE